MDAIVNLAPAAPPICQSHCDLAANLTAISTLIGVLVWPLFALIVFIVLWRGGRQGRLAKMVQEILQLFPQGAKVTLGLVSFEVPADIRKDTVRATTQEGETGASLADVPQDILERLQADDLNGPIGTYPYLCHSAVEQRPRTTPRSGRYSVRTWVEFDPKAPWDTKEVKRVLYRLHESWAPGDRVIATEAAASDFELWLSIYGEFTLIAVVEKTDGELVWLSRYLDLPGRPPD